MNKTNRTPESMRWFVLGRGVLWIRGSAPHGSTAHWRGLRGEATRADGRKTTGKSEQRRRTAAQRDRPRYVSPTCKAETDEMR